MKNVSQENVATLPVLIPPLSLQEHYTSIARRHERIRAQQREGLRQAEHLFQSVLHQAFGEEVIQ
jgi:type I restriction enzyme S subunit